MNHETGKTLGQRLFQYRSYTPVPLIILAAAFARPTIISLTSGFVVLLAGEGLRLWTASLLGGNMRATHEPMVTRLITSGPFAYVRNPAYLGNVLIYLGVGLMSMALFPWLLIGSVLWFSFQYSEVVKYEEKFLSGKFPEGFPEYVKAVRRFLPRITRHGGARDPEYVTDVKGAFVAERRTLQAEAMVSCLMIAIFFLRH